MTKLDINNAIKQHLEGKLAYHKANLLVFIDNPVGVAEHGDFMETMEEQLSKIAHYEDMLGALERLEL